MTTGAGHLAPSYGPVKPFRPLRYHLARSRLDHESVARNYIDKQMTASLIYGCRCRFTIGVPAKETQIIGDASFSLNASNGPVQLSYSVNYVGDTKAVAEEKRRTRGVDIAECCDILVKELLGKFIYKQNPLLN